MVKACKTKWQITTDLIRLDINIMQEQAKQQSYREIFEQIKQYGYIKGRKI